MPSSIAELSEALHRGGEPWLLLFDIDGTLVDTGGKGMAALRKTAIEVFGGAGPPLDLAGSTDLGILENLYIHFGIEASDEQTHAFFEAYHRHLADSLESNPGEGMVLDGAVELLETLVTREHAQLALLTGNTSLGAEIKLRHYGLGHHFSFGAFGSDRANRNDLGVIALERALAVTGREYHPDRTLIIGDTPKDIACAHAIGARCLAVATGQFSAAQLMEAGADWVIGSLREIQLD
ncbi:MAG: haloacid dehalogenase-like hydrolase [Akkermansiaceae bacterium]|jgi:phosphoglycolate phosphatase|nr:haloacid dehalogenase-like hydrolase [Akkermansiaceae bacterium]MDP4647670.1 haloacid dehalogenase-like hydrolase [Akkermansiaceae bacterium]MDP4722271.1 haloacid dehalogenase-like hydrolase [Akkermansiaceae bacterium]MDP4780311.1 haloacid dehalogenase-like hydrolase [Akkermansiaceae bacterium]MDP4846205.1 haloacid dehalogenase-like hydrolase [Akkermansiaceae bacterium]